MITVMQQLDMKCVIIMAPTFSEVDYIDCIIDSCEETFQNKSLTWMHFINHSEQFYNIYES